MNRLIGYLTFNSLYGIRLDAKLVPISDNDFQFPLWDTSNPMKQGNLYINTFNSLYGIHNVLNFEGEIVYEILSIPFMGYIY